MCLPTRSSKASADRAWDDVSEASPRPSALEQALHGHMIDTIRTGVAGTAHPDHRASKHTEHVYTRSNRPEFRPAGIQAMACGPDTNLRALRDNSSARGGR